MDEQEQGPNRGDLDALKDGAAMLSAAGNRVAALSLLWSAVAIDPLDLTAHRRLAATLASGGDVDGAANEFARYIEFVLPLGDLTRAMLELTYGVTVLGGHQALHGVANRIADEVRALVPGTARSLEEITKATAVTEIPAAIAAPRAIEPIIIEPRVVETVTASPVIETVIAAPVIETVTAAPAVASVVIAPTADVSPIVIAAAAASPLDDWVKPGDEWIMTPVVATTPVVEDPAAARRAAEKLVAEAVAREPIFIKPLAPVMPAMPAPRLLPKVPFRFCLHPGGDKHWMQLEGGAAGLVPDAVRVIDRWENVVDERLCLPMRGGDKGHAPVSASFDMPAMVWVVVAVPSQIVHAYEAGLAWSYSFQARVKGEWLAMDLVDSGCRLNSVRPLSAS